MNVRCQFLRYYESDNTRRRPVERLGLGSLKVLEVYPSVTAAGKAYTGGGSIVRACKNGTTAGGFRWRYRDE